MIVVYIAGPYTAATEWGTLGNIQMAEAAAATLWQSGFAALCPHKNTAHFGGLVPYERFIAGDLAMLERCDAVFMLPGSRRSPGATRERSHAQARGVPVFDSVAGLLAWARARPASMPPPPPEPPPPPPATPASTIGP